MTPDQQIEAAAVLASILEESGTIYGRIRLQKLVYLLQHSGVQEVEGFTFLYHHYGPYSEDLADFVKRAVFADVVSEKKESFDDEWQRYEYTLGASGNKYARMLDGSPTKAKITDALQKTEDKHWRALELAATAMYFIESDGLSLDVALDKAISRKPACGSHRDDASDILSNFGIIVV